MGSVIGGGGGTGVSSSDPFGFGGASSDSFGGFGGGGGGGGGGSSGDPFGGSQFDPFGQAQMSDPFGLSSVSDPNFLFGAGGQYGPGGGSTPPSQPQIQQIEDPSGQTDQSQQQQQQQQQQAQQPTPNQSVQQRFPNADEQSVDAQRAAQGLPPAGPRGFTPNQQVANRFPGQTGNQAVAGRFPQTSQLQQIAGQATPEDIVQNRWPDPGTGFQQAETTPNFEVGYRTPAPGTEQLAQQGSVVPKTSDTQQGPGLDPQAAAPMADTMADFPADRFPDQGMAQVDAAQPLSPAQEVQARTPSEGLTPGAGTALGAAVDPAQAAASEAQADVAADQAGQPGAAAAGRGTASLGGAPPQAAPRAPAQAPAAAPQAPPSYYPDVAGSAREAGMGPAAQAYGQGQGGQGQQPGLFGMTPKQLTGLATIAAMLISSLFGGRRGGGGAGGWAPRPGGARGPSGFNRGSFGFGGGPRPYGELGRQHIWHPDSGGISPLAALAVGMGAGGQDQQKQPGQQPGQGPNAQQPTPDAGPPPPEPQRPGQPRSEVPPREQLNPTDRAAVDRMYPPEASPAQQAADQAVRTSAGRTPAQAQAAAAGATAGPTPGPETATARTPAPVPGDPTATDTGGAQASYATPQQAATFQNAAYNVPAAQSYTRQIAAQPASSHANNFNQPFSRALQQDRAQYKRIIDSNPELKNKILRIMYNEQAGNPQGTQAVAESMFNRASMRGETLEQASRWHIAEPRGYYQRGRGYYHPGEYARYRPMLERSLNNALAGSNISNYATDNSSGSLARGEMRTGKFKFQSGYTGETFSSPQSAEPVNRVRWNDWTRRMIQTDMQQQRAPDRSAQAAPFRPVGPNPLLERLRAAQQSVVPV